MVLHLFDSNHVGFDSQLWESAVNKTQGPRLKLAVLAGLWLLVCEALQWLAE